MALRTRQSGRSCATERAAAAAASAPVMRSSSDIAEGLAGAARSVGGEGVRIAVGGQREWDWVESRRGAMLDGESEIVAATAQIVVAVPQAWNSDEPRRAWLFPANHRFQTVVGARSLVDGNAAIWWTENPALWA